MTCGSRDQTQYVGPLSNSSSTLHKFILVFGSPTLRPQNHVDPLKMNSSILDKDHEIATHVEQNDKVPQSVIKKLLIFLKKSSCCSSQSQ